MDNQNNAVAQHTPGPWFLAGRTVYALNEEGFNRFSALVQDAHAPAYELNANASLIAAAPELLEACEAAEWNSMDLPEHVVAKLSAAIDKARGAQ